MIAMARLGTLWNSIQTWLLPMLEDELGELDEKHREFVAVCETCDPRAHMDAYLWVAMVARPIVAWRCARLSSPRPTGISPPPAT